MIFMLTLLGITIGIVAILLLINPEAGFAFGRKHFFSSRFQYGTGVFSLVLAVAFYNSSPESKFPILFEVFALISLIGGIVLFVLPSSTFKNIVSWELKIFSPYGRALGLGYALVGSFLVYAAN